MLPSTLTYLVRAKNIHVLAGLCFCKHIENAADRAFGVQRQGPRAFFGAKGSFGPLRAPLGFLPGKNSLSNLDKLPKGPLGVALRATFSWPTPGKQGSGRKIRPLFLAPMRFQRWASKFAGGARSLEGWARRFEGWAPRIWCWGPRFQNWWAHEVS